jgi:excisionase family DNA binding protein
MFNDLADLKAELDIAQTKLDNALIGARIAEKSAQDAGAALARVQAALKAERRALPQPQPSAPETNVALAVRPKQACKMLGCGPTTLYRMIGAGELEVFKRGKATLITTDSIRESNARALATKNPPRTAPPVRRGPRRSS